MRSTGDTAAPYIVGWIDMDQVGNYAARLVVTGPVASSPGDDPAIRFAQTIPFVAEGLLAKWRTRRRHARPYANSAQTKVAQ